MGKTESDVEILMLTFVSLIEQNERREAEESKRKGKKRKSVRLKSKPRAAQFSRR